MQQVHTQKPQPTHLQADFHVSDAMRTKLEIEREVSGLQKTLANIEAQKVALYESILALDRDKSRSESNLIVAHQRLAAIENELEEWRVTAEQQRAKAGG